MEGAQPSSPSVLLLWWAVIDDFCKQLVARHPASIGCWLLGLTAADPSSARAIDTNQTWQLLDRELSSDAHHADSVMAERMLEYWIRLHRRFRRPIQQVVLHLKPTASPLARVEHLTIGRTRHHFTSLRLWEQDPAPLLADPALLPLAVLARPPSKTPEQLLSQVRQRLQTIADPNQRRRTTSGCQLLAGLSFSQDVIQRLLAMSILEDSSVYQYIVHKGLEQGLEQGRQQEACTLVLRLLERRCGPLQPAQRATISALPLERLEALVDVVLDFQGTNDLLRWLEQS
jgi:predicted transposase YdaD